MKSIWNNSLAIVAAGLVCAGCSDSSTSTSSSSSGGLDSGGGGASKEPMKAAVEAAAKTAAETTKAASQEVSKAMEAAKPHLQEAAKVVKAAVNDASVAAQAQFTNVVADVKKLIAEGKGSEAMQKVKTAIGDFKLTPEQQKSIDDLLQQAKAALSKENVESAKKAVGDLLKPKQ